MGTLIGSPAICASLAVLIVPSTSDTSVEVPPMSNAMMFSNPLPRAVAAAPTTPPAGPESTVRTGSRAAVGQRGYPTRRLHDKDLGAGLKCGPEASPKPDA